MTLAVNIAQGGSNNVTFRNRIINGAMVISQRGTSFSANGYTLDRYNVAVSTSGAFTVTQSSTAPTGFSNSLAFTKTTGAAPAAGEPNFFFQTIEGYNIADLAWGTASAKAVTLSFWAYSGATGTFGGSIREPSAGISYPFTYTISSANTWTYCSTTIAGPTSGTWPTGSTAGMNVFFDLGSGSNYRGTAGSWQSGNYVGASGTSTYPTSTSGGAMYWTGIQLEAGSAASPFEYRSYGTELNLCMRYFFKTNPSLTTGAGGLSGCYFAAANGGVGYQYPVPMRSAPTITRSSTNNTFYVSNVDAASPGTDGGVSISTTGMWQQLSSMTSAAVGYPIFYNGSLSISAEL